MSKDNYIKEKSLNFNNSNKKQNAKNSLNNYIKQLKIHFDLKEEELTEVIKAVLESQPQNKTKFIKKGWQIWK